MVRRSPSPEDLIAALSAEAKRRTLSADGTVHPFFAFKPANEAQDGFMRTRARTQIASGANRSGKSLCGDQKCIIHLRGSDPNRVVPDLPVLTDRIFKLWLCVPAKFTRDALREFEHRLPPDMKHKTYWTRGEEQLVFEPTERRQKGAILAVKSTAMPPDEFQREAVDVVRFDEAPRNEGVWSECSMRLVSTSGVMILTFTPINLPAWLYKKCLSFSSQYLNAKDGDFAWFKFLVEQNPFVNFEEVKLRTKDFSENEYAIRVLGEPRLMVGRAFFQEEHLLAQWKKFAVNPSFEMVVDPSGDAAFISWHEKKHGWSVWERPVFGVSYAIGADVAKGVGGDYSVAIILNCATGRVAATFSNNEIEGWEFGQELMAAGLAYHHAVIAPEVNIEASAVLHPLRQYGYPRIYRRQTYGGKIKTNSSSLGWYTDSKSKGSALEELRAALKKGAQEEPGGIIVPDAKTLTELMDFGHLEERRPGAYGLGGLTDHDDRVMALAIATQAMKQAPKSRAGTVNIVSRNYIEQWEQELLAENRKTQQDGEDDADDWMASG